MIWIAPNQKDATNGTLEKRLWEAADQFRPKKCELRSAKSEVQSVRHSTFRIRHSSVPASLDYDAFGRIYEYFLGEFARTEGQKEQEPSFILGNKGSSPFPVFKILRRCLK